MTDTAEDDHPDEWQPDDEGDDEGEADPWAAINAARKARYAAGAHKRAIGAPDNSWTRANTSDRATALRVLAAYDANPKATVGRLCADLWIRPPDVYTARWLLIGAGMLRKTRNGYQVMERGAGV